MSAVYEEVFVEARRVSASLLLLCVILGNMRRLPLFALFLTVLIDMIGVGILLPVLPQLFANPASPHYLLGSGTSAAEGYRLLGLLLAVFSLGQFLTAPIFGQLSDKIGRKKVLIWSLVATAFGYVLFAIGLALQNLPLLFFARGLSGLMSGNIVIAQAMIGDLSHGSDRAKNFGLIGAAFGLGFIVGPLLGGLLADPHTVSWFSAATPFWFAAILSVVNVVFVVTSLSETHTAPKRDTRLVIGQAAKNVFHAWRYVTLRPLFITNFLLTFGFMFYTSFIAVFLTYRFHYAEGDIGKYFAFVGVCIAVTQGVVTRLVAKRMPEERVLSWSLAAIGLFIAAVLIVPSSGYLYLNVPFLAVAVGLSMANMSALISKKAGPERQGEVMGLNGSVTSLAMLAPQLLAGFIAAAYSPTAPLYFAVLLTVGAGIYFVTSVSRKKEHET